MGVARANFEDIEKRGSESRDSYCGAHRAQTQGTRVGKARPRTFEPSGPSWPGISETFRGHSTEPLLMVRLPQFDLVAVGIVYPGETAVAFVLALRVDVDPLFR